MTSERATTLDNLGKLALRLSSGGLMLTHGIPKLMNFSAKAAKFPDPLGIGSTASLTGAVATEVGCSLLIMIGLMTRPAALPAAFTMVIAAFVVHAGDPFARKEKALLYLVMYLALACMGPGEWSVDGWLRRRKEGSAP